MPQIMDIDTFIRQEVTNQGHDVNDPSDGGIRCEWMREAWEFAQKMAPDWERPMITCIETMGTLIEPEKNEGGMRFRTMVDVRVGGRKCPKWDEVQELIYFLTIHVMPNAPALEAYRIFQLIHPFADGNGRVGKIIYNWLLGTLDDPQMPVDLFGGGIP